MTTERKLPAKRNNLVNPVKDNRELIARRRLGQTELSVDAGQVGTSNATKPKNLGVFDYAHIRVPLPKDLKGSGIFHASRGKSTPEAYFLMRRSSDGFVSASGMFKVAFPWASEAEEKAEKAYLTKLPGTSKEETAGNIWVPPQSALDLADEYEIRDWVLVLLDPSPIINEGKKSVKSPPVFHANAASPSSPARSGRPKTPTPSNGTLLAPPETSPNASPRKRALRSASPTKIPAPEKEGKTPRKIATPKPRTKRARTPAASESVEPDDASATESKSRKASRSKKEASAAPEDVKPSTEDSSSHPILERITDEARDLFDSAKKAVQDTVSSPSKARAGSEKGRAGSEKARAGSEKPAGGRKRKAADISSEEPSSAKKSDKSTKSGSAKKEPEAKRRRVADIEERKATVKRRAAVGIAAGLAIGAVAPYVFSNFLGF